MSTAKKKPAVKKSSAAKQALKHVPIVTHYSNDSSDNSNEQYLRSMMIGDGYVVLDSAQGIIDEFPTLEAYDAALKNDDFEVGAAHYLYRITPVKIVVVKD